MILLLLYLVWNITVSLLRRLSFAFTPFLVFTFPTFFTRRPSCSFTTWCFIESSCSVITIQKLGDILSIILVFSPSWWPLGGGLGFVQLVAAGLVQDRTYSHETWFVFPTTSIEYTSRTTPRSLVIRVISCNRLVRFIYFRRRLCLESVACFLGCNKGTEVEMLAPECISVEIRLIIDI